MKAISIYALIIYFISIKITRDNRTILRQLPFMPNMVISSTLLLYTISLFVVVYVALNKIRKPLWRKTMKGLFLRQKVDCVGVRKGPWGVAVFYVLYTNGCSNLMNSKTAQKLNLIVFPPQTSSTDITDQFPRLFDVAVAGPIRTSTLQIIFCCSCE